MKSLGQILERLFSDPQQRHYFVEGMVVGVWSRAVGPAIARVAKPEKYENGVLLVHVDSAAWRNELSMMSDELIRKLNDAIGRQEIRQIVFR